MASRSGWIALGMSVWGLVLCPVKVPMEGGRDGRLLRTVSFAEGRERKRR